MINQYLCIKLIHYQKHESIQDSLGLLSRYHYTFCNRSANRHVCNRLCAQLCGRYFSCDVDLLLFPLLHKKSTVSVTCLCISICCTHWDRTSLPFSRKTFTWTGVSTEYCYRYFFCVVGYSLLCYRKRGMLLIWIKKELKDKSYGNPQESLLGDFLA